jgi:uncharacterized membrane protein
MVVNDEAFGEIKGSVEAMKGDIAEVKKDVKDLLARMNTWKGVAITFGIISPVLVSIAMKLLFK